MQDDIKENVDDNQKKTSIEINLPSEMKVESQYGKYGGEALSTLQPLQSLRKPSVQHFHQRKISRQMNFGPGGPRISIQNQQHPRISIIHSKDTAEKLVLPAINVKVEEKRPESASLITISYRYSEQPFPCLENEECPMRFITYDLQARHHSIHHDSDLPYYCDKCKDIGIIKRYRHRNELKEHMKLFRHPDITQMGYKKTLTRCKRRSKKLASSK